MILCVCTIRFGWVGNGKDRGLRSYQGIKKDFGWLENGRGRDKGI